MNDAVSKKRNTRKATSTLSIDHRRRDRVFSAVSYQLGITKMKQVSLVDDNTYQVSRSISLQLWPVKQSTLTQLKIKIFRRG
jgi:hypothetical protein